MTKAPPRINQVAPEREELHSVSGPMPGIRLPGAHVTVLLEVRDVPVDSLRDLLDQLALAYRVWPRLVVLGSELSTHLLPTE